MPKEDIKIFVPNNVSDIQVFDPNDDTRGMGIDGLLQSEYYGLQTSYDKRTSEKYQKRQDLYIKLINNEATEADKNELRSLSEELGGLPFSNNTIDFIYDDFIKEYKNSPYYLEDYLTPDQIAERKKYIKDIISSLFEEKV